jgi:hypothetical protein
MVLAVGCGLLAGVFGSRFVVAGIGGDLEAWSG